MTKGKDSGNQNRCGPGTERGRGHGPSSGYSYGYGHGPDPGYGYNHSRGPGYGYGHGHGPSYGYGPAYGYGLGPGYGHGRGSGYGRSHGSGHGYGHFPRGKASGSHGRGRGRANDAISRSEQFIGRNVADKLGGDSAPSSAESVGSLTSWSNKQPHQSGLHELLLGLRTSGREHSHTNKDTDSKLSADGRSNRRGGQLSWVDMRRQSQRSNSTADSSSETDVSQRSFQNFCGTIGGWGGRGRGRLLDSSSIKKPDNDEEDTSVWSGRGRGGILYVPGVHFHSGRYSTGWKHYGTGNQGTLNSRHSVGGFSTNYAVQSPQMFPQKENVTAHSNENKHQRWKKKTGQDKECNNGTKVDNCVVKEVTDLISPSDDNKLLLERKHSNENIEENLEEKLVIRTDDAFCVDDKSSVVSVNSSTEQNGDSKEYSKPRLQSPHGGRTRGIILFGGSLFPNEGTLVTQNPVIFGSEKKEKPSDL